MQTTEAIYGFDRSLQTEITDGLETAAGIAHSTHVEIDFSLIDSATDELLMPATAR